MSRFSIFRWGKSKSDSDRTSRAGDTDRFVADGVDRKKNSSQKNNIDDPQLPQKKRARRRLVGSVTLVVAAIIVLPMIFESEPKQASPNLLIDIPSKEKSVQAQVAGQTPQTSPTTETAVVSEADQTQPAQSVTDSTAATTSSVQQTSPTQLPATGPDTGKPQTVSQEKIPESDADRQKKQTEAQLKSEKARQEKLKAEKARQEKERAEKLKAEKAKAAVGADPIGQMIADKNSKTSASGKQLIQVAALTSPQKVSELQAKLSKAGIRSHTQKVKSANGEERIRVRVGPLNKSDVEKTCTKLKNMGLSCTLLPI